MKERSSLGNEKTISYQITEFCVYIPLGKNSEQPDTSLTIFYVMFFFLRFLQCWWWSLQVQIFFLYVFSILVWLLMTGVGCMVWFVRADWFGMLWLLWLLLFIFFSCFYLIFILLYFQVLTMNFHLFLLVLLTSLMPVCLGWGYWN